MHNLCTFIFNINKRKKHFIKTSEVVKSYFCNCFCLIHAKTLTCFQAACPTVCVCDPVNVRMKKRTWGAGRLLLKNLFEHFNLQCSKWFSKSPGRTKTKNLFSSAFSPAPHSRSLLGSSLTGESVPVCKAAVTLWQAGRQAGRLQRLLGVHAAVHTAAHQHLKQPLC